MISYNETFFPYFKDFCLEKFGTDAGMQLFEKSEIKLNELVAENDDRNNKYIKWHLNENMLPIISIYLILKELDYTTESALKYTDEMMQICRLKMKKKNEFIGKLPFAYSLFRIFSKRVVLKQYPDKGWDIQWITRDENEVHFDMKSCIYVEITNKYNCSELCSLFCANDDVVLSGFQPSIIFKREKTIAKGHEKCDFYFYNSKLLK